MISSRSKVRTIGDDLEAKMIKFKRGLLTLMIAVNLMCACSSTAPSDTRQWQPTSVTDFKSVAGKWEGLLMRDPRQKDWVTLVIGDTGAFEFTSFRTIGVFAGKGQLSLTDGKLSAKSDE